MARFLSRRITANTGATYEIEFNIDRIAALRETLSIEVVARRNSSLNEPGQEIQATLDFDLERREVLLKIEGEEAGKISLDAFGDLLQSDEADAIERAGGVAADVWDAVRDNLLSESGNRVGDAVEGAIQALPAFDPILGCLLKGAISAVVGQVIRCYRKPYEGETGFRERLRDIAKCLGRNAWGILGRASWRATRCMITLGFF
jgi:hypothetical protein